MHRATQIALAVLIAFAALAGPAQAAPAAPSAAADLDTNWAGYGAIGQLILDFPGNLETTYPYGDKIIALGGNGSDFVIALYAADGQLDPSFGGDGIVTVDFAGGADSATAVRPYGGQFLVAGSAGGDFGLVKLNADGSPDGTFGSNGKVTVDFNGKPDRPVAVLLRGDGKILLAGSATEPTTQNCSIIQCQRNLALARFDFNTGALDSTFDSDGKVQTDLGPDDYMLAAAYAGVSIVAAGATCEPFTCQYLIASYTLAGAPDTTFDGDGLRTGSTFSVVSALAVAVDGKIMAAGPTDSGFGLLRLNPNGSPDPSFGGGDGLVTDSWGASDLPKAIVYLQSELWLAGGATDGDRFAFTRFDDAGEQIWFFDTTTPYADAFFSGGSSAVLTSAAEQSDGRLWGLGRVSVGGQVRLALTRHFGEGLPDAGGWQVTHSSTFDDLRADEGRAAVFQPDGKLIVAGTFTPGNSTDGGLGLVRYTAAGDLDPTFGDGGLAYLDLADSAAVYDAALQPDGKILLAGYTEHLQNNVPVQDFLAARFNADGSPDLGFGSGGVAIHDLGPNDKAYALALQPDGKIILVGEALFPSIQLPGLVIARLLSGGGLDSTFGTGGYSGASGAGLRGFAVALQPDGKIVAAGTFNGDFIVFRYTSTGGADPSFNGSGEVFTNFGATEAARAVLVQPDGNILAFGDDGGHSLFARYLPNGAPDASFDSDGKLILPAGASEAHALALQGSTILALGCDFGVQQRITSLYRLRLDGSPEVSGQPFQDFAFGIDFCAYDLALGSGRIALAGTALNHTTDFAVAMLQADYHLYLPLVTRP